jgi:subtilase family serine protease
MCSSWINRKTRAMLLASSSALLTGALAAPSFAAPSFAAPSAARDLGALPDATTISATIWLRPHDEAAFNAAVSARMTRGSALYHHWMSAQEVAAYNATDGDVAAMEDALRAQGLTVQGHADDHAWVRVSGTAAAMQAAFRTKIHLFGGANGPFYAATGVPAFAGAHAALIAGVTGLTNAHMTPYVLHQIDFATGKPALGGPAILVDPRTDYTDQCFKPRYHFTFSHFSPGGAAHDDMIGPRYTTGVYPAKRICGYRPAEIAAHYGLNAVYQAGYKGDGQTIVLIDAYGSPTIPSDANIFSKKMGLPPLNDANFSIIFPEGPPSTSPYPTGWTTEISLDVEWAHAVAPNARLVLVVAPTDDEGDLSAALHYAVSHHLGTVISNSYGYPESEYGPAGAQAFNTIIRQAAAQGIAVNVATGDSGDFGLGTPVGAASIPADSPYATGVGGTSLNVPGDNGPVDSAWGITTTFLGDLRGVALPPDFQGFRQGGGGGESGYLPKPGYQNGLVGAGRLLPDVSAFADPQTGGIIVAPNVDGTETVFAVIGGTSLATPVFSGIWALANQAAGESLGQAAPVIAAMPAGALTDILPIPASASNLHGTVSRGTTVDAYDAAQLLDLQKTQPSGFVGVSATFGLDENYDLGLGADSSLRAGPGWDDATGWGEPNGMAFINAAAAAASH